MSRLSALACAAAALAFCGPAPGQNVNFPLGELIQMELPSSLGGSFRNSVAGHFTRLHCNDAVVLVGQNALMVHAPAIHRSAYALPMPETLPVGFEPHDVHDIVTVPHGRIAGHDALALVTGGGLWLWTYEVDANNEWSPHVAKLGGSAWNGALKLRSADVDGDGNWDILGLMSNGSSIRCYRRGSPTPAGWVMQLGGPVRDFAVFDFVPGGTPEIVALTGELERREGQNTIFVPPGLRAYSTTGGSLLFEQSLANDRGVVLPWMRTFGEPPTSEARVIVATTAGTTHAVQSFTNTGSAFVGHGSYALTDEATALAVGKFLNSPSDVLLATLRHEGLPVRIGINATGTFTVTNSIGTGPTSLPAGVENFAQPLLVDFYGAPYEAAGQKHSAMLLYPQQSAGFIAFQREIVFGNPFVLASSSQVQGSIQIDPASRPMASTHLEVLAWSYDIEQRTAQSTAESLAYNRLELSSEGYAQGPLHLPEPEGHNYEVWFLVVRFLQVENGAVVKRWPSRIAFYGSVESGILDLVEMFEEELIPCPPMCSWEATLVPGDVGVSGASTQPPSPPGGGSKPPPPPGG